MEIDQILKTVQKPTRYIGSEYGSVHKDPERMAIRFAFCFADVYEVGMSHLGMKILYHLLNDQSDIFCERVFAPWPDMEEKMRASGIPLFSQETRSPVRDFDFVGFTLQYEMCNTNLVNMLDLAGIPLLASDREDGPFVCAGGPCAYNPEPLADFIDFFMLGEGEEMMLEVMDVYRDWKRSGASRESFLRRLLHVDGVYVPRFYDVSYRDDGTIDAIRPNVPDAPPTVRKRIIADLDHAYFPDKIIVPFMEPVHDRIMLELFRGCIRGCRFCQAGVIYRPVRERSPETLLKLAEKLLAQSGYEEISLSSLSTSDYTRLPELADGLLALTEANRVGLSLPSLRLDSFSMELMQKAQKVRKSGLTFAPEAGTQRLRDVINKGIAEEDLLTATRTAFSGGYGTVKLYFMIGLPTETMEDVDGIAQLAQKVVDEFYRVPKESRNRSLTVTVSASSFVPKPFTPFQWEPQDTVESLREKQRRLKEKITDRRVRYNWHESLLSSMEGVFARGDRRLSRVLIEACRLGAKFDGWHEFFDYDRWMQAFDRCGIDPSFYNERRRSFDEVLPWDHIDVGVSKDFLRRECEKAYRGETTPNCRESCGGCGIKSAFGGGFCG